MEEIGFSDEADTGKTEALSIKEIILRQIRKIGDLSTHEFTGSYWEKKPIKTGSGVMFTEVYHEDLREAYCNAVDFLIDLIYPMGDKELKKYLQDFEGYIEKITKDTKIEEEEEDIDKRMKLKRQTFRQINIMFESNDFWKGSTNYNE